MKFVVEFEARKLPRFAAHYLAFSSLHRLACEAAEASRGGGGGGGAASPPRALSGRLQVSAEEAAAASARFAAALHAELMRIDGFVAAQRAAIVAERQAALRAGLGAATVCTTVNKVRAGARAAAVPPPYCFLLYYAPTSVLVLLLFSAAGVRVRHEGRVAGCAVHCHGLGAAGGGGRL
jgi:hypothetical protein